MKTTRNFSKLLLRCTSTLPGKGLTKFFHFECLRGQNNTVAGSILPASYGLSGSDVVTYRNLKVKITFF